MKRITVILTALILTVGVVLSIASASVGNIEKSLLYNDIKITLNGEEIKPCDVNGNYIEPFIIEGTTYLPVRGIASSLGLTVGWDGNTNTVKLNEPLKETVALYDKNKIKISFKKYEYTAEGDIKLILHVENGYNSNITLRTNSIAVNGKLMDMRFKKDFAYKDKGNADIIIKAQSLKDNNITYIKEIELVTDVINSDNSEKLLDNGVITITPQGATLTERETVDTKNNYEGIAHQDYIDFIKANGEKADGRYKVTYSFFHEESEDQRPTACVISLSCSDENNKILVSALLNKETLENDMENTCLEMTISPNTSSYSFEGKMIYPTRRKVTGKAASDKRMLTPDGLTIDKIVAENYNVGGFNSDVNLTDSSSRFYVATHFADMLKLIAEHGDGLFERYGSELTLGFFGMEK